MVRLRERPATAARALEFLILNANRTSEVIGARHDEIEGTIWTVPAIRTKMGVPHDVVLCARSSEIVADMSTIGGPYLFGGEKPLSNMAMTMLLRRMGVDDCTVHGFRSGFKDWALNETEFPDELSEEALAHLVGSSVRRAYRRGVALERRRGLMESWERFLSAT